MFKLVLPDVVKLVPLDTVYTRVSQTGPSWRPRSGSLGATSRGLHWAALPWYCITQVSRYIKYSPVKLRREPRLMKVWEPMVYMILPDVVKNKLCWQHGGLWRFNFLHTIQKEKKATYFPPLRRALSRTLCCRWTRRPTSCKTDLPGLSAFRPDRCERRGRVRHWGRSQSDTSNTEDDLLARQDALERFLKQMAAVGKQQQTELQLSF